MTDAVPLPSPATLDPSDSTPRRAAEPARTRRAIALWLYAMVALLVAMVLLGGVTRLTHSGLSIVEWQPISGVVPPLSHSDWLAEFQAYQQYPEYQKVNQGMSLADFKAIYWFEYSHRLLGRLIGVAFALPLLGFIVTRQVSRGLALRLLAIFALGAAQGFLGWFMVKSGLVNDPAVSHYRLTAHLGLAVAILGLILWTALSLSWPKSPTGAERHSGVRRASLLLTLLVYGQILLGGLVAGLHAGLTYNTWPLMDGRIVPTGLWQKVPWWRNPLDSIVTVQFDHRMLAYLVALGVLLLWLWVRRVTVKGERRIRRAADLLLLAVAVQVMLGIATLLAVVPVALAAVHQGGALVLFGMTLVLARAARTTATH